MSIPYNSADQVKLGAGEAVRPGSLNTIYAKLIQNDISIRPDTDTIPGIWECRWWGTNDPTKYYKKGAAVWLNTEQPDLFIKSYEDDIYAYCQTNSAVAGIAAQLRDRDVDGWEEFCRAIVAGTYSRSLPPLYWLGDITKPVQLMVSLVDGNNTVPTEANVKKGYWRKFFIGLTDAEVKQKILSGYGAELDKAFNDHIMTAHLSGIADLTEDANLPFLKGDMSNVDVTQHFENHAWLAPSSSGFAYVKKFVRITDPAADIKLRWFRIWSNGLLEHGGIVQPSASAKNKPYQIDFNWQFDSGKSVAPIYDYPSLGMENFYSRDIKYLLASTDPTSIHCRDIPKSAIRPESRYSVVITPEIATSDEDLPYSNYHDVFSFYEKRDVTGYTNSSFQIFPTTQAIRYSYYVRGYSAAYRRY